MAVTFVFGKESVSDSDSERFLTDASAAAGFFSPFFP